MLEARPPFALPRINGLMLGEIRGRSAGETRVELEDIEARFFAVGPAEDGPDMDDPLTASKGVLRIEGVEVELLE